MRRATGGSAAVHQAERLERLAGTSVADELWRHLGPAFGKVRAKVKHVFRVMGCQFD